MFTPLARGYGTLNGELRLEAWTQQEKETGPLFPSINQDDAISGNILADHRHGITVSPRAKSAFSSRAKSAASARSLHTEKPDGELLIPKTFITRKGALLIFTDNEMELSEKDKAYLNRAKKVFKDKYVDYSSKLGSISRLTQSVLNFGDKDSLVDEDKSISDPDNKVHLEFLKELDEKGVDLHSRPGGDVNFYLRDLKSRATSAKSRCSATERPGGRATSFGGNTDNESSTESQDWDDVESTASSLNRAQSGRSSRPVLSADKLAASLKSNSFLGRPKPQAPTPIIESDTERSSPTSTIRSRPQSGHSLSDHSRPQSGRSRPQSGRSRSMSKGSLRGKGMGGSVSNIPEGISEDACVGQIVDPNAAELRSLHDSQRSLPGSLKHVDEGLVNENDGMQDAQYPDDGQSVASSLLQEQDILLPHEEEGLDEAVAELGNVNKPGSRRHSHTTSIHSHKSSRAPSISENDGFNDVFNDNGGGGDALVMAYRGGSGLMSQHSGTFSLDNTQADNVKKEHVVVDDAPSRMLTHSESLASLASVHHAKSPQDETLVDLRQARSRLGSTASSHSGMATERARTVLAEEGINSEGVSKRRGSAVSHSRHSSVQSRPGSGVSSVRADSAQPSRPGSAQAHRSSPSAAHRRPSSSRSNQGAEEKRADTPAPPCSPAASRPHSPSLADATTRVEDKTFGITTPVTEEATPSIENKEQAAPIPVLKPAEMNDTDVTSSNTKVSQPDLATDPGAQLNQTSKPSDPETAPVKAKPPAAESPAASSPKKPAKPPPVSAPKDKTPPGRKKQYTKALDINQVQTPGKRDKKSEQKKPQKAAEKPKDLMSELAELYQSMPKEEKPTKTDEVKKDKPSILKGKSPTPILPQKTKAEEEYEELQKDVGSILDSTVKEEIDEDSIGFSPEELELQKKMLQEKMAKAQELLKGADTPEKGKGKKGAAKSRDASPTKKLAGKKKGSTPVPASEGEKRSLEEQREALREARKLEKQKRLEEAKQLEDKIKSKEVEKQKKIEEAKRKKQLLDEDLRAKKAEAAAAKEAEEEARAMLAATRKEQREEREAKRKAEIERKKDAAAQRRADQKAREEAARKREMDMLMRIADNEERRRLEEQERKRKEEEDEKEREQREEDERAAIKALEEEEEKISELERQAEEEAMTRLIDERELAERERREIEEEARRVEEEEESKKRELEEEQRRLEEEALRREAEEERRKEGERLRLLELQRLEEEARDGMRVEMERRRDVALRRRDVNLDRRSNMQGLKNGQGITKPWVFSYYLLWPRETYERLMGEDPKKKKGFRPTPKKKPKSAK